MNLSDVWVVVELSLIHICKSRSCLHQIKIACSLALITGPKWHSMMECWVIAALYNKILSCLKHDNNLLAEQCSRCVQQTGRTGSVSQLSDVTRNMIIININLFVHFVSLSPWKCVWQRSANVTIITANIYICLLYTSRCV